MAAIGSRDCCFFGRNSMRNCSILLTDCGSRHVDENVTYFLSGSTFQYDLTFMVSYVWTGFFFHLKAYRAVLSTIFISFRITPDKNISCVCLVVLQKTIFLYFSTVKISKPQKKTYIYLIWFSLANRARTMSRRYIIC